MVFHCHTLLQGLQGEIRTAKNLQLIDAYEKHNRQKPVKNVPLYITELGFRLTMAGRSTNKVAQYVMNDTLLAQARELYKGVWWYDLIDDGTSTDNKEHNFGFDLILNHLKSQSSADGKITQLTKNYSIQVLRNQR